MRREPPRPQRLSESRWQLPVQVEPDLSSLTLALPPAAATAVRHRSANLTAVTVPVRFFSATAAPASKICNAEQHINSAMFGIILPVFQAVLPAFVLLSSIYFHSSPISYRIPLRKDQKVDYLKQPLKKYAFPHIGFKPELAPTRSRAGWHGRAPFIAKDGKTILQEFFSFPYSAARQGPFIPDKPKALVIMFPGLGDSVERVAVFADELAR